MKKKETKDEEGDKNFPDDIMQSSYFSLDQADIRSCLFTTALTTDYEELSNVVYKDSKRLLRRPCQESGNDL